MPFSSLAFVSALPFIVGLYWLLPRRNFQDIFLLLASSLFLSLSGISDLAILVIILCCVSFIVFFAQKNPLRHDLFIKILILALLTILFYFKYLTWISTEIFGIPRSWWLPQQQPMGISYYIFILIGILLDIPKGGAGNLPRKLPRMVLFFPILLSGPIVRFRTWSVQWGNSRKKNALKNITAGTQLFMLGCFKKILIADAIATTIAPVWTTPSDFGADAIAFALFGFYLQLYADFSGYTDMARGIARMMGFHLPVNFRAPYLAATPMEFWSSWHISLTSWIRDNAFTPMSISIWRRVRSKKLVPIVTFAMVVGLMTLVGLWHGASSKFILFGMLHGVCIGIWYSVVGQGKKMTRNIKLLSWLLFQLTLMLSLVLFRADTFAGAGEMLSGLFQKSTELSLNDGLIGLMVATAFVFFFQYIELKAGLAGYGRSLVALRNSTHLLPLFVIIIWGTMYMRGLTLEGVWISPADPFFNAGQEKFIYFKF